MLDSIFIAMLMISFILTLVTVFEKSLVFNFIALMCWLVLFGQSLYITDVSGTAYSEYGVSALCLCFVFVHVILTIVYFMDYKENHIMP